MYYRSDFITDFHLCSYAKQVTVFVSLFSVHWFSLMVQFFHTEYNDRRVRVTQPIVSLIAGEMNVLLFWSAWPRITISCSVVYNTHTV